VKIAVDRLRAKVSYTTVAARLLPEPFTFLDLQTIHEIILGRKIEKKTLMRRYINSGLLEEVKGSRHEGRMRPAKLYRLKNRDKIHYFVRTMEGPREE
jgi:8-oxo-dGTP diphosphatase